MRIAVGRQGSRDVSVTVDDDGGPMPRKSTSAGDGLGLGLGLAKRLTASIGGLFIPPLQGTKRFELRLAVGES